jgi:hypothetical protein
MKISRVLQVISPDYIYLRLRPNNSIRNQNTHMIARSVASLYRRVWESIKKEDEKILRFLGKEFIVGTRWELHRKSKVSYYIYMEKTRVEFYFIVPSSFLSVLKERVGDVWPGLTIEEVPDLPTFSDRAEKRQIVYEKEDALSLKVDRRDNALLSSNLNIIDVLGEGDRVGILYNFIPSSQTSFIHSHRATMEKIKSRIPVDRNKTGGLYLLKLGLSFLDRLMQDLSELLSGQNNGQAEQNVLEGIAERLLGGKKVSESTEKKSGAVILDTQILIMSDSEDTLRRRNNAYSLAQSFDIATEDNRLQSSPFKGKINFTARRITGAAVNRMSDLEIQNLIALPGREMLERFKSIHRIETQETEVPAELQQGVMCIGMNTYRGKEQPAYISNDREYKNLTLVLVGPTRAGKSTLIGNISRDAIAAGECVVIFDFIKNCELSGEVAALFPPNRQIVIDCGDPKKIQGLGFNEVGFSVDPFLQYDNAKKQATQLLTLINAVNSDDTKLSAKMERYLTSAALAVFITGGSIRDVFNVLQDHKARHRFIKGVPKAQMENLSEYIDSLRELDERDKGEEVCGTRDHLTAGVIDRLNKLKQNTWMEAMLKRSTEGNIDLVEEMQKPQLITIRMPESMFSTDAERDVYTTYWISKLWLALQIRGQRIPDRNKLTKVNIVIDELYQVENTQKFLRDKLSRLAKFAAKPIISCHYINQIGHIRTELRSANASYMLISGCDKKNYEELKDELYPYEVEDLLHLPRYHSLNLIKCGNGYSRFITRMPEPFAPACLNKNLSKSNN